MYTLNYMRLCSEEYLGQTSRLSLQTLLTMLNNRIRTIINKTTYDKNERIEDSGTESFRLFFIINLTLNPETQKNK